VKVIGKAKGRNMNAETAKHTHSERLTVEVVEDLRISPHEMRDGVLTSIINQITLYYLLHTELMANFHRFSWNTLPGEPTFHK